MCFTSGVNLSMRNSSNGMCGVCSTRSRRLSKMEIWQSCRRGQKHYTDCSTVTSGWRRNSARAEHSVELADPTQGSTAPMRKRFMRCKGEPLSFSSEQQEELCLHPETGFLRK